jgi:serine/threonine-protein kinase SRPK3
MDVHEEPNRLYSLGRFYPVQLGEIFDNHYKVLRKLGYGLYSTVWLVKDITSGRFYAMKVLDIICYAGVKDIFELEILQHLGNVDSEHRGHNYVSQLIDSFETTGPSGRHTCLVFPVMGESFMTFGLKFSPPIEDTPPPMVPSVLMKRFVKQLLLALDYAHCNGIIHTGKLLFPWKQKYKLTMLQT